MDKTKQKSYGEEYRPVRRGYRIKLKVALPIFFAVAAVIITLSNLFLR